MTPSPESATPAVLPVSVATSVAELIASSSIELSTHNTGDIPALAANLPSGTRVYVNHLPGGKQSEVLTVLREIRRHGLEPVPHLAARRITSRTEAHDFVSAAVNEAAVSELLLLGGDPDVAAGPYADAAGLLKEAWLAPAGIRRIGFAGYPEGHPRIPRRILDASLAEKLSIAAAQGLGTHIVTQFSFAPGRIIEYCGYLARLAPGTPVYVGVAGPTDPATLLRFAQRCGVSASLRALRAQGMALVRAVTHTDPSEQLAAIARYCAAHASCNVVGAHLFTFGAATRTADWMTRMLSAPSDAPAN